MRNSLSAMQGSATQADVATVSQNQTRRAVYQCLIVSQCNERSEMLGRSAEEVGWDLIVCRDAQRALMQAARHRIHLAFIDLVHSGAGPPSGFRKLSEQLATRDGPLLVVCGHEGDALEEIWARQLGVWLYLPGVTEESNVILLCDEARAVVEKLDPQPMPHQPTGEQQTGTGERSK